MAPPSRRLTPRSPASPPLRPTAGGAAPKWRSAGLALLLPLLGASLACQNDGLTTGKQVEQSELYWALELNHRAVTLATPGTPPYDTLTLVATPRTMDRAPLLGLPAVTYVSSNPEKVTVTADGVLRAIEATTAGEIVSVVATLTAGNLKHVDTALVKVVAVDAPPPPVLETFSIHPVTPDDSAKAGTPLTTCFAMPSWTSVPNICRVLLPVTVLDTSGTPIAGVPVAFRTSDLTIAAVQNDLSLHANQVPGKIFQYNSSRLGQVTFYASTTVFGRMKADTLPFRIGLPVFVVINPPIDIQNSVATFPPVLTVGVGALIAWQATGPDGSAVDVTFSDPTNVAAPDTIRSTFAIRSTYAGYCEFYSGCGAGNIVLRPSAEKFGAALALRQFPVPGVYDYYSAALGMGARVVVVDER